jgi:selenocysteine-specific elongation factor
MALTLVVAGYTDHGGSALVGALGLAGPDAADLVAADRRPLRVIDPAGPDELLDVLLAAGPLGVDAHLLVAPADEEISAQTREQAALLRAFGIDSGLAVVTRAEVADPAGVLREIGRLVPSTQAHAVSLETGDGVDALRSGLAGLLAGLPARLPHPAARFAGEGPPPETRVIDAALDFGPDREREPEHGARVVVALGGVLVPARLHRLGGRFWQVRLDRPLRAAPGDRLVVRRADPPATLGGGVVLDPAASRHPTSNEVIVRLTRISRGQPPLPPDPRRPARR